MGEVLHCAGISLHRVVGAVRGRRGTQRWGGRGPSGRPRDAASSWMLSWGG